MIFVLIVMRGNHDIKEAFAVVFPATRYGVDEVFERKMWKILEMHIIMRKMKLKMIL